MDYYEGISPLNGIKKWAMRGEATAGHGRLVFFFAAKKKARQLENKASTKGAKCGGNVWEIRWPGCSAADNETCATFRRHSRRQEHDKVCSKISKMCGNKHGVIVSLKLTIKCTRITKRYAG